MIQGRGIGYAVATTVALLLFVSACSERPTRAGAAAGAGEGGGGAETGGSAGAGGAGVAGDRSSSTGVPGPSCRGLSPTCGPEGNADCCASRVVPGGTFERDNGLAGDAIATISDFRLDQYEVTVGRFRNFVAGYADHKPPTGSGRNPNNPLDPGWEESWNESLPVDETELVRNVQVCDASYASYLRDDPNLPMNCITWFEAYAFCIWDGGRLPTDAELNYAAAGGSEQRVFPWSVPPQAEEIDASRAAFLPDAPGPLPVGSKSPLGDGRWGHADLSGNEWEWCQDWYRAHPQRCINCADLSHYSIRVIRGGSFYSEQQSLYSSSRLYHAPNQADFGVGVRCARAP